MASDAHLARQAEVPPNVIAAIREIESGGHANAVRFEPHLFHRKTGNVHLQQVAWTRDRGSVSLQPSETNRAAFLRAYQINPRAAVESTSWGRYQVLGSTGIRLYGSPELFLRAFNSAPAAVSDQLLVAWFHSRPAAQEAARACDVSELAYRYNGSRTSPWSRRFAAAVEARGGCYGSGSTWTAALGAVALLGALGGAGYFLWRQTR